MLLKPATIDGPDPSIDTVDRELVGRHAHDWAVLLVRRERRPVVPHPVPRPEDPRVREGRGGMGVGDLGQGGHKCRVDYEPVDGQAGQRQQRDDREEGESHYRQDVQLNRQPVQVVCLYVFSVRRMLISMSPAASCSKVYLVRKIETTDSLRALFAEAAREVRSDQYISHGACSKTVLPHKSTDRDSTLYLAWI